MRPDGFVAPVLGLVLLLSACGAPAPAGASPHGSPPLTGMSSDAFVLDFDAPDPLQARPGTQAATSVLARRAQVKLQTSGDGTRALRFPRHDPSPDGPRLVLLVTSPAMAGELDLSRTKLAFGADVQLDADAGLDDVGGDSGANVLQRGRFSDAAQYKLQVDRRRPSCRVKAGQAEAFAQLKERLGDGWYRLSCVYHDGQLTVTAQEIGTGRSPAVSAFVDQKLGVLPFPDRFVLSIGGHLSADQTLVSKQSDQLNGALDNVFVDGDPSAG